MENKDVLTDLISIFDIKSKLGFTGLIRQFLSEGTSLSIRHVLFPEEGVLFSEIQKLSQKWLIFTG